MPSLSSSSSSSLARSHQQSRFAWFGLRHLSAPASPFSHPYITSTHRFGPCAVASSLPSLPPSLCLSARHQRNLSLFLLPPSISILCLPCAAQLLDRLRPPLSRIPFISPGSSAFVLIRLPRYALGICSRHLIPVLAQARHCFSRSRIHWVDRSALRLLSGLRS